MDVTCNDALSHAARILTNVETITDQTLMERYTELARSWIDLAAILADREKV